MAKQIDGTEFACLTINADLEAENEKLKKQLALTEKALELACIELMPYRINMCGGLYTPNDLKNKIKYFKQQAEREVENE